MTMKTIILVILYNKSINKSETLISLNDNKFTNYDLIIYNNGPKLLDKDLLFDELQAKILSVKLCQDMSNKPLSIIYNEFLSNNKQYERFVIFDDDTVIPGSFFSDIDDNKENLEIALQLPLIKSKATNDIYYPAADNKVVYSEKLFENDEYVLSIGSGLIIYPILIDLFNKNGITLFDERFALYGVDFSLFRRIHGFKNKGEVINIQCASFLWHSLSRSDAKDSLWRQNERLIDTVLSILHYSPVYKVIYSISKLLIQNIVWFNVGNVKLIIKILIMKKHPRCK
ncbi:hypothetical protein [Klebsiella michiganensis]|uniref:hypothetical protein n=1 Tax=Klebsiella michiganensis TaxID=1134687 RepID=UPI001E34B465|nr:hypothetical protein [Klebsiella michiganensis]UHC85858.1 hypothetical protein LUW95_18395 [Klebsiella michiganensis]